MLKLDFFIFTFFQEELKLDLNSAHLTKHAKLELELDSDFA
jgi:hypothetical protein